jgi:hypothetical protein
MGARGTKVTRARVRAGARRALEGRAPHVIDVM